MAPTFLRAADAALIRSTAKEFRFAEAPVLTMSPSLSRSPIDRYHTVDFGLSCGQDKCKALRLCACRSALPEGRLTHGGQAGSRQVNPLFITQRTCYH